MQKHLLPQDRSDRGDNGVYNYAEPYTATTADPETLLIRTLAATRPFKRLTDIRFLGALDYCLVTRPNGAQSNARFTRAQHSIGVAALTRAYLGLKNHSKHDRLLCVAAAMLHDIGHAPFSHTLEPVFKKYFNIDHHQASERIISGEEYSDDIPLVLEKFGIRPSAILEILNGDDARFDRFFSGPINVDTIEGILRSRYYLRMQNLGVTPLRVVEAATQRDDDRSRDVVDSFWHLKDEMYTLVIRSKLGVLFDTLFQEAAKHTIDEFCPADFYLTESQAFKKFPALRDATQKRLWRRMIETLLPAELNYQARRFYIEESADFFAHQDSERYRQSKTPSLLTLKDVMPA